MKDTKVHINVSVKYIIYVHFEKPQDCLATAARWR